MTQLGAYRSNQLPPFIIIFQRLRQVVSVICHDLRTPYQQISSL